MIALLALVIAKTKLLFSFLLPVSLSVIDWELVESSEEELSPETFDPKVFFKGHLSLFF